MSDARLLAWLFLLLFYMAEGAAMAASVAPLPIAPLSEFAVRMPSGGKPGGTSPATGLTLRVDASSVGGYGYRDVRFRFDSPVTSPSDRLLTVKFYAGRYSRRGATRQVVVSVERDGELTAGAATTEVLLPTPDFEEWQLVWWDVWIDGVRDASLSRTEKQAFSFPSSSDFDQLHLLNLSSNPTNGKPDIRLGIGQNPWLTSNAGPRRDDWLSYTPYDAVTTDLPQLLAMQRDTPASLEGMLRWVSAGGSLWVADVDSEDYTELDRVLRVDRQYGLTPGEDEAFEGPAEGWEWGWIREFRVVGRNGQAIRSDAPVPTVDELLAADGKKRERPPGKRAWFAERQYGFGKVTAFLPTREARRLGGSWFRPSSRGPSEVSDREQAAMNHWRERSWTRRHGLAPDAANNDFSNLLVPGVGLAPVTEFQILITLFVVVVGPVNYWLLKQRQRTHLMVFTVPASAVTLTLALLLYALLADGFGTTVRVRAVTLLDQPRGEHATWGRLSYYSGLAPSEGLTLPRDCAMYPLLPGWNDLSMAQSSAPTREVEWADDAQRLKGGWLRSRAPTQYLQVRSGEFSGRLDFDSSSAGLRVTNDLGADLEWLLVFDRDGELFEADELRDAREADLAPIDRLDATRRLRTYVVQNEPFPPEGLTGEDSFSLVAQERRVMQKRLQQELELDYASVRADQSLLNQTLDELTGLSGGGALRLPPQSYVAVAKASVGVDLGMDNARESGSFHIVVGRW